MLNKSTELFNYSVPTTKKNCRKSSSTSNTFIWSRENNDNDIFLLYKVTMKLIAQVILLDNDDSFVYYNTWFCNEWNMYTFKMAARNKSGQLLMAAATKSPPALYPQPASLFSCTNSFSTRNLAQETKSLIELSFFCCLPLWCHALPWPPPPLQTQCAVDN